MRFSPKTAALAKKIDKIAEAGSLVPGDVHNCVRRIVAVQEALDRCGGDKTTIAIQSVPGQTGESVNIRHRLLTQEAKSTTIKVLQYHMCYSVTCLVLLREVTSNGLEFLVSRFLVLSHCRKRCGERGLGFTPYHVGVLPPRTIAAVGVCAFPTSVRTS